MLNTRLIISSMFTLLFIAGLACQKPASYALKNASLSFQVGKVWDLLAARSARLTIEDSQGSEPITNDEIEAASKVIYSDFLIYMNEVGVRVELAKMQIKHRKDAERVQPGAVPFCSESDLKNWNAVSMQALDLDYETFEKAYCERSCTDEQDLFKTVLDPVACTETASKLYNAYQCDASSRLNSDEGSIPGSLPNPDETSDEHTEEPISSSGELPGIASDLGFEGSTTVNESFDVSEVSLASGFGLTLDLVPMPSFGSSPASGPSFSSTSDNSGSLTPPRTAAEMVARKLMRCGKASEIAWVITIPNPIDRLPQSSGSLFTGGSAGWSTPIDPIIRMETEQLLEQLKPGIDKACETVKPESEDSHSLVLAAYQLIRFQAIESNFGHLAIGDENLSVNAVHTISIYGQKLEHTYDADVLNAILAEADSFFLPLLQSSDALKDMRVCAEGDDKKPDTKDPSKELDELIKQTDPLRAFGEAVINGISFGAEKTGAGANARPPEFDMVLHGEMTKQQIGDYLKSLEAKGNGDLKRLVTYLQNNQHYPIVEFLGEVTGGVIAGTGISSVTGAVIEAPTAAKALSRLASEESGFLSKIFAGTIESIKNKIASLRDSGFVSGVMRPFASSEGGHIGAGARVLQTGGNILNNSTARQLNKELGKDLPRREWGRALELLKKDLNLQNSHHGKILSNGDYMSASGRILGNIADHLGGRF